MSRVIVSRDGTKETGSHWEWNIEKWGKPVITVDFHHTITKECPACKENLNEFITGGIQEGAVDALHELSKSFKIIIYTGSGTFWNKEECSRIVEWLKENEVPFDEIRFDKPPACFMIDDRGIHHRSWKQTLKEIRSRSELV